MNDITNTASAPRPKAYSYLRFSTPEQGKGNSYDRQMLMARTYAKQHGFELDEELTFHDLGVSAYRGQNRDAGRLAYFLEAVRSGLVPQGSVLLVEQLDRISRMAPRKALRVLEDIVEAGVSLVTLNDGRRYTLQSFDNDPIDLMLSILTFMRANEESATRARRLAQAWEAKRASIGEKPLTSRCPAWLRLKADGTGFELVPDRAEVVRRIFAMTLEGVGQHKIAETFNREDLKPWGRAKHWQRSYIVKVLGSPAAIGTVVPSVMDHSTGIKRRVPQEPVEGYYPPVVSAETFANVQALREVAGGAPRGRQASAEITNILSRLATCPSCGSTMTRVQKGKRSRPSLVCTSAKAGAGCAYKSIPYADLEGALIRGLPARLGVREGTAPDADLEQEIADADALVDHLKEQAEAIADNLAHSRSRTLSAKLREIENALEVAEGLLQKLFERREASSGPLVNARIEKALASLQPTDGPMIPAEANRGLRSIFSKAVINWPEGMIELHWTHGGVCEVPYGWRGLAVPGWRLSDADEELEVA